MRLFVVSASWPDASATISPFLTYTAPHPPGPGFGTDPPSVNTPSSGPPSKRSRTSAGVSDVVAVTDLLRGAVLRFVFPDFLRWSPHSDGVHPG